MKKRDYEKGIIYMKRKILLFFFTVIMIGIILNGNILIVPAIGVTDRDVIVGFYGPVGQSEKDIIHGHGGKVKKDFHIINAVSAKVPEDKIDKMKKDPKIRYVEEEKIYNATDKYSDEYSNSWGVLHIGSQPVHNQSIYGNGIKIAVLDTGIDYNHPDLVENYKGGYDFAFEDSDPFDYTTNSHGTHVSGIIAAKNNGFGVVGVAPGASIYAVKVLDDGGGGMTSWIISGIQWAVDNDMKIVTMSFSCLPNPDFPGYCESIALNETVNNAYGAGLLLIAAGGNYGGEVGYPAKYESVIAVTATDQNDQITNIDPTGPEVEIAAPGVDINSTIRGGGYGILSGTSMATPHVAGAAALIYEGNLTDVNGDGYANNKDVRMILQNTAKDLGDPGMDNIYGYGLVDASNAVLGFKPDEPIHIIIKRTTGPEYKDAKDVFLSEGKYLIEIRNINLSKLTMTVYDNDKKRNDLSSVFKFKKTNTDSIMVNMIVGVGSVFKVVFTPYGVKNTICYVSISRI